MTLKQGKLIIIAAPSGTGKSTLIAHLMSKKLNLQFSISATSRPPRGTEQNGVEYYFLTPEEFKTKIQNNEFLEYCEVYKDRYYGTLKSEVDRILSEGKNVILDLDVIGALNIKKIYQDNALSLFILPPSIEVLRKRLEKRATDAPHIIDQRIERAQYELEQAPSFDKQILNDDLKLAQENILKIVSDFIKQ